MCPCAPRHWKALPLPEVTEEHHSGVQPCVELVSTLSAGTLAHDRSHFVLWPMCISCHVPTWYATLLGLFGDRKSGRCHLGRYKAESGTHRMFYTLLCHHLLLIHPILPQLCPTVVSSGCSSVSGVPCPALISVSSQTRAANCSSRSLGAFHAGMWQLLG